MSRDFLLVLGGGLVSLVTTLVVLYVTDMVYRRDSASSREVSQDEPAVIGAVTGQKHP